MLNKLFLVLLINEWTDKLRILSTEFSIRGGWKRKGHGESVVEGSHVIITQNRNVIFIVWVQGKRNFSPRSFLWLLLIEWYIYIYFFFLYTLGRASRWRIIFKSILERILTFYLLLSCNIYYKMIKIQGYTNSISIFFFKSYVKSSKDRIKKQYKV